MPALFGRDAELQELSEAFRGTETAVLVDYRGVTVPQVTELRRQIRAAAGEPVERNGRYEPTS